MAVPSRREAKEAKLRASAARNAAAVTGFVRQPLNPQACSGARSAGR